MSHSYSIPNDGASRRQPLRRPVAIGNGRTPAIATGPAQVSIVLDLFAPIGEPSPGMRLGARSAVRALALLATLGLAGCPSAQHPGTGDDDGDGGVGSDAGPACPPVPTCTATIQFHGTANSVSLRGDFAADGWTTGIAMTPIAGGFEATIPANDNQVIVYKFVVDGTSWIADPGNARKSPDGYGAFNSVMRVDCDHCPARAAIDWRDAVMYFVMVDRFYDGSVANDAQISGVEYPGQYQGGDFVGVRQKIEAGYFADLGVNTLWITSPLDNADNANPGSDGHTYSGYHGYWPKDLDSAESHFGTEAELKAMVDAAHAHGMQVLIDYVMNHVHQDSPVYQQHPDWFWPNSNGQGGDCVCGHGCSWDSDRLRCWFDPFLPDFNFTNAAARKYSVDNAVAWAKRIGIDGFRLDAVKHIETSWLTDVRARLDAEVAWDQPFYMVGETFDGDRGLIKSYVDKTMLDGQFDFPLRGTILSTLLRRDGQMSDLVGFLDSNDGFYGANAVMSTFLGNHDVPRSVELALDAPMFGAWDGGKNMAWSGQPTLPVISSPFQRLAVAYTLLMTMPGIPMIYYGDEYGMAGAGDPDNRRFMQWTSYTADQTWLHDRIAVLAKLRGAHPATRRGTRTTLGVTGDAFVYKMSTASDTIFVAMNRGDSAQDAPNLPVGTYTDLVTGATVATPLTIPPRSAFVLAQ
jgi:glycosidase